MQCMDKLRFVEAVFLWMIHESADERMGDVSTEDKKALKIIKLHVTFRAIPYSF